MIDKNAYKNIVFILLVVSAGCAFGESKGWSFEIEGETNPTDSKYRLSGEYGLNGYYTHVKVTGTTICFFDSNRSLMKQQRVGTLDGDDGGGRLNTTFDQPPEYVLITVNNISESGETKQKYDTFWGLKRGEDGSYRHYGKYNPQISGKPCELPGWQSQGP